MVSSTEQLFTGVFSLNKLPDQVAADLLASILLARTSEISSLHDDIKELSLRYSLSTVDLKSAAQALKSVVVSDESEEIWRRRVEALGANPDLVTLLSQNRISPASKSKITATEINQLVNLSWNFVVTASSSELSRVGSTYLQLKLELQKSNGSLTNKHIYLSLPQFYDLLHELEKAKTSLEYSV